MITVTRYGFGTTVRWPFEETIGRVTAALKDEGFGVLTTIDVQATLKEKLGVDTPDYVILGACNPRLAHTALEREQEIGLLLPCNVIVYDHYGETHVSALDPEAAMQLTNNEDVIPIAKDAKQRLERVIARLSSDGSA